MGVLLNFFHSQLFVNLPYPSFDFSGKTIIVTGANTGLGLEAAKHFTRLNAERVVLAVRNLEKGNNAKKEIEDSTKRTGVVSVWELDLSRRSSVESFVKQCEKELPRLDILVENAGITSHRYSTVEGYEQVLAVNFINTFYLGLLILPLLRKSATDFKIEPRIVIISSEMHIFASLKEAKDANIIKAINDNTSAMAGRYSLSKLLEIFATRELAKRLEKEPIVVNCVNPGLCKSELTRNVPWFIVPILALMKAAFARTSEVGSRVHVYAAAVDNSRGQYISDCAVVP